MPVATKDPLDGVGAHPRAAVTALALTVTIALLGACSSSAKPKSTTTPTPTGSSASSASGSAALTGDAATIRSVYVKFIDPKVPVAQKGDLIQDGVDFKDAMVAESKNPAAQTVSLDVTDVKITSPNLATVTFTLLVSGSPLLPNQHGFAVRENGTWKVAGTTFCGLLAAQGPSSVPPACSKPAATALPS